MNWTLKTLLVFLAFTGIFAAHPFYLSVTNIKYNTTQSRMQVSVKMFTNDIEDALKKLNGRTVDLVNPRDTAATMKILEQYISKRLLLNINGKDISMKAIGFEREEEATWIYLESARCPAPKKLTVTNSLLYDYIREQTNIVHVSSGKLSKSGKVSNPEKKIEFTLP